MQHSSNDPIIFAIVVGIVFIVHFMPSFLAFMREHPSRKIILFINIVIGWTIIGWGILMYWALKGGGRRALV